MFPPKNWTKPLINNNLPNRLNTSPVYSLPLLQLSIPVCSMKAAGRPATSDLTEGAFGFLHQDTILGFQQAVKRFFQTASASRLLVPFCFTKQTGGAIFWGHSHNGIWSITRWNVPGLLSFERTLWRLRNKNTMMKTLRYIKSIFLEGLEYMAHFWNDDWAWLLFVPGRLKL